MSRLLDVSLSFNGNVTLRLTHIHLIFFCVNKFYLKRDADLNNVKRGGTFSLFFTIFNKLFIKNLNKMAKPNPKIEVIQGDITSMQVDVIVNAANSQLKGGGGVDGAIHRKGGPTLLQQCRTYVEKNGKLPAGEVMHTDGGNLNVQFIFHTVGPIWKGGTHNEAQELANCYHNALQLAETMQLKTIAFPNISTGVYCYPKPDAASIAMHTVDKFLKNASSIEKVYLVCFDDENYRLTLKHFE